MGNLSLKWARAPCGTDTRGPKRGLRAKGLKEALVYLGRLALGCGLGRLLFLLRHQILPQQGAKIHRFHHQWRKTTRLGDIGQDLAGKRENHPRTFHHDQRVDLRLGDIQHPEQPPINQLH